MSLAKLLDQPRELLERIVMNMRNSLAVVGLAAVAFVALDAVETDVASRVERLEPTVVASDPLPREEVLAPAQVVLVHADARLRAAADYLSRRYQVAAEAAEKFVSTAFAAGQRVGIDPLLILAVAAIESRFNPIAQSNMGAKGLMQVIPKYHLDKFAAFGGESAVLEPAANIQVGARILKDYIRTAGSVESGLQLYNGAPDDLDGQYAQKVMAERQRLEQALARPIRLADSRT